MERNVVKLILQNICNKEQTLEIEAVETPQVSSAIMQVPKATIRKHLEKYQTSHPQAVNTLKDSLYVDDFIASSSDVEDAYALTTSAREILSTAGMNLCKWTTNSPELKAKWQQGDFDFTLEPEAHGCVLKVLYGGQRLTTLPSTLNTL